MTTAQQAPLPQDLAQIESGELAERIRAAKARLGKRLVILGHHYQRDEIIQHADFRGDSYKLCLHARDNPYAEFIVFCGVHFMAESADILKPGDQKVILPNLAAGCSMADMANIFQVKRCWAQLREVLEGASTHSQEVGSRGTSERAPKVVPVTYINSAANLKAFVGEHRGTVCTSTNAPAALNWALSQSQIQEPLPREQERELSGTKVLFFPDQHLGRNTAVAMGFDPDRDMCVWDPFQPFGGNSPEKLLKSKFILWKGHCSVHKRFTVDQIEIARQQHPEVQVIVHPECTLQVVEAADLYGSTEYILHTIEDAPPGTTWAVGTEINLVQRIAKENPDKTVFCLDPQICPCSTMYRIHPTFLCWVLESLVAGELVNQVVVPPETARWAQVALDRMLKIGSSASNLVD